MKKWIAGISAAVLAFTGVASAVPGARGHCCGQQQQIQLRRSTPEVDVFLRGTAERRQAGLERGQLAL